MYLQTHTCCRYPPAKLLREPVLQQHHKGSLVHTYRSISRSHWAEWDRYLESHVPGQDRDEKELQFRKPYGASRTLSQNCEQNALCSMGLLEALSFPPGTLHWNPVFIFFTRCRGRRASPLHRDGEGASNWQPAAAKWFLQKTAAEKAVLRIAPTSTNPLRLHTALTISGNTVRGWRITAQTTHLHSLTMTSLNFLPHALYCWSLTHNPLFLQLCNAPHTCLFCSMVPLQLCQTFTILSTFFLPSSYSWQDKDALSELFLVTGKLQRAFVNRLDLPSMLFCNTIWGCRCLEVKKQISASPILHIPLRHSSIQSLYDLFLNSQC